MFGLDMVSLLIGLALGYLVLPHAVGLVTSKIG